MAPLKSQHHTLSRRLLKTRYDFVSSFPLALLVTMILVFSSVIYNTGKLNQNRSHPKNIDGDATRKSTSFAFLWHEGLSSLKYSMSSKFLFNNNQNNPNGGKRPIMHTFFQPIRTGGDTPAGMSQEAHQALLKEWEAAWQQAGWDTKVLTVQDAKKHPEFEPLSRIIQTFDIGEYDKLCFIRWIAMAATNSGGWMSDYDVFPLHDFRHEGVPNNGAFTMHDGYVPSLASGSKSEWLRMIKRMIDHAQIVRSRSDMFAVEELGHADGNLFRMDYTVMPGNNALTGKEWTWECRALTYPPNKRAVHFSHRAIQEGRLQQGQTLENRAEIASEWLQMWLQKCGRKQFDPNEKKGFLR
mmetsp:Transcript_15759/g.24507  ORF Transcript_15759/g.24507 Transcript_15759/m.24507 type:complete len:354 (+) Transcript_15759:151-1212(+)